MYKSTAGYYDKLTSDIDYRKYAEFFCHIVEKHASGKVHSMMDMGCGTGNFTLAMAAEGFDMTGIDSSSEMLSCALSKSGPEILWINQNLTELDLFGTYDAAVSLLDCVNHLLTDEEIEEYFRLVHNYVNPGGLFIFDINTEYKLEKTFSSNVFYTVEDDFAYIWHNEYDSKEKICRMDITLFIKENELYKRVDAVNHEKAYDIAFLSHKLTDAGFNIEAVYDDGVFGPPGDESERVFFVCRRKNSE